MSNEVTISQMNEVIARFMGFEKVRVGYFGCDDETEWQLKHAIWMDKVGMESVGDYFVNVGNDEWMFCDDSNYDKSWDALMPVVEEIESLDNKRFGVCIDVLDTMIMDYKYTDDKGEKIIVQTDIYPDNGDTKISITHDAVYQFITWYNEYQQKQTNE